MEQITVKEAVKLVVGRLGKLKLPIELYDELGFPIKECVDLLRDCVASMERAEEAQKNSESNDQMGDVDFGTAEEPAGEPEGEADA